MAPNGRWLATTAVRLPPEGRARLAKALLASLEEFATDQQQPSAAKQQRDAVCSGRVDPVAAAEVYHRLDRLLRK